MGKDLAFVQPQQFGKKRDQGLGFPRGGKGLLGFPWGYRCRKSQEGFGGDFLTQEKSRNWHTLRMHASVGSSARSWHHVTPTA